jgi:hypothetical protein
MRLSFKRSLKNEAFNHFRSLFRDDGSAMAWGNRSKHLQARRQLFQISYSCHYAFRHIWPVVTEQTLPDFNFAQARADQI